MDEDAQLHFKLYDSDPFKRVEVGYFQPLETFTVEQGNQAWFQMDYAHVFSELCERFSQELDEICLEFGRIDLTESSGGKVYTYHPLLGIFTGDVF